MATFKYQPKTKEELKALCKDLGVHLRDINTSLITDMSYLFEDDRDLSGIEHWDVSNVKTMDWMFSGISASIPYLGNWNVSNLESAEGMFKNCSSFVGDTLIDWTPKSLKNRTYMFENAGDAKTLDVRAWRVHLPNLSDSTLWELTGDSVENVSKEMREAYENVDAKTFSLFETISGFKYKNYIRMFLLSSADDVWDELSYCGMEPNGFERDTKYLLSRNAHDFLTKVIETFSEQNIAMRAYDMFEQEAFLAYKDIFDFISSGKYSYPISHLTQCEESEFASNFDSIQDDIVEEYCNHCVALGVLDKDFIEEIFPVEPAIEKAYARCECGFESPMYPSIEEAQLREGDKCPECGDDLDFLPESYKNEE